MSIVTRRRTCARSHRAGPLLRAAVLGSLLLVLCTPARADDNPLQRAHDLRNDTAKDWNNKAHAEAASKLRKALEIYAQVDGEKASDRAITLRALVWNLVRAGALTEVQEPYDALLDIAAADPSVYSEVTSAYSAVWEAASAQASYEEGAALLTAVRESAGSRSLKKLEGQAVHSLGSLARTRKETKLARLHYKDAIALRRESGDAVGETWSLNNLANLELLQDGLTLALDPLRRAYILVHQERIPQPQQAVAWNVKKAIEFWTATPDVRAAPWLRALQAESARSGYGAAIPPSYLDRQALALAEAAGDRAKLLRLAKAMARQKSNARVSELHADLTIRAALATARAGEPKRARGWLTKLDVGKGPCMAHLEARRKTALAITYATKTGKRKFAGAARSAASAWRDLGDFEGRREALTSIVTAAKAAGLQDTISGLVGEQGKAMRAGGPGGDGGSATAGGDRSRAGDVPLDGATFYVTVEGNTIRIEDRIAKHEIEREVRWKPARFGVNGLSLTLFGGYLVVESMNYGGGASASSAPGSTTLDALGIYMPIPAKGALVILKNGAVRYETAPVSPR